MLLSMERYERALRLLQSREKDTNWLGETIAEEYSRWLDEECEKCHAMVTDVGNFIVAQMKWRMINGS